MSEHPVAGPSGTQGGTLDPTDDWAYASRGHRRASERGDLVDEPLSVRGHEQDDEVSPPRGWMEFRSTTPTRSSTFDTTSRRSDTIELRDGTVVRRLPSPPLRPTALSTVGAGADAFEPLRPADDPFRASSDLSMRGSLFTDEGNVRTARRLPTRSDSDPQSLASTTGTLGPAESAYDLSAFGTRAVADEFDENDEESAARSPLRPTTNVSPWLSTTTSHAQRLSARPYLAPISTSPTELYRGSRKSVDVTQADAADAGGWTQLTPTRSSTEAEAANPQGLSPLAHLSRKDTLNAAMKRIRRVSVRVVNLHENDDSDDRVKEEDERPAEQDPRARSPDSSRPPSTSESLPSKEHDDQSTIALDHGHEPPPAQQSFRHLRGKTLGIFGPEHSLRKACAAVLTAK